METDILTEITEILELLKFSIAMLSGLLAYYIIRLVFFIKGKK